MSHNTWIHRFVRVDVRPLVHTPVTPNHLTNVRLLTGLGASAIFAVGSPAALIGLGVGLSAGSLDSIPTTEYSPCRS